MFYKHKIEVLNKVFFFVINKCDKCNSQDVHNQKLIIWSHTLSGDTKIKL